MVNTGELFTQIKRVYFEQIRAFDCGLSFKTMLLFNMYFYDYVLLRCFDAKRRKVYSVKLV